MDNLFVLENDNMNALIDLSKIDQHENNNMTLMSV